MDCEGCLFLVRRQVEPLHQLVVLNKMSPEDDVTSILPSTELEVNSDYLMMSTPDKGIIGYWFYDSCERELVVLQLQKIVQELQSGEVIAPAIPYAAQTSGHVYESGMPEFYAASPAYLMPGAPRSDAPDRERFKRALIKLIQTDDDFVDRIYDAFSTVDDDL